MGKKKRQDQADEAKAINEEDQPTQSSQGHEEKVETTEDIGPEAGMVKKEQVEELERRLKEQEERYQALFNQWQRLQADFDNYRKRMRREQEELREYAACGLVERLLPVLDNFGRALAQAKKPATGSEIDRAFRAGVEMIYRQLNGILEAAGLKRMEAVGKPFDPRCHEAMAREDQDQDASPEAVSIDMVLEEYETGYWFKDRVLRPARVKVGSQVLNPEPQPEPEPKAEAEPEAEPGTNASNNGEVNAEGGDSHA